MDRGRSKDAARDKKREARIVGNPPGDDGGGNKNLLRRYFTLPFSSCLPASLVASCPDGLPYIKGEKKADRYARRCLAMQTFDGCARRGSTLAEKRLSSSNGGLTL